MTSGSSNFPYIFQRRTGTVALLLTYLPADHVGYVQETEKLAQGFTFLTCIPEKHVSILGRGTDCTEVLAVFSSPFKKSRTVV
jgi:hypothetical protein